MSDFTDDVRERKNLSRAARYRKNGSKSRKCPLPQDYMTKKELQAMNGNVESYSLGVAKSYKEYSILPNDLKKQYVNFLCDRFKISQRQFASMLGVSLTTATKLAKEVGGWPYDGKSVRQDAIQRQEWNEFTGNIQTECCTEETKKELPKLTIGSGVLSFTGNICDISSKLVSILGVNCDYEVSVSFEVKRDQFLNE